MASAYKKAKAWYVFRYRLLPWCGNQWPGVFVGVVVSLLIVAWLLPPYIQRTFDSLYTCSSSTDGFVCKVKERHAH